MDTGEHPIVDFDKLQNACLDNEALVARLLRLYLGQAEEWAAKLRRALAAGDYEQIRFVSHTIKGGSSTMHAEQVRMLAEELHAFVTEENAGGTAVASRGEEICRALGRTVDTIEHYLAAEDA